MISSKNLSGHVTWQGPILLDGVWIEFDLACAGLAVERLVHAWIHSRSYHVRLEPGWAVNFQNLGIPLLNGGKGLSAQLKQLVARITGLQITPEGQEDFFLRATLSDDVTRDGLLWRYHRCPGQPYREEIFQPVDQASAYGAWWRARPIAEVYPIFIGPGVEQTAA